MIYCKICKCLKKEVKSGDLKGTTEDLEFIESLETITLIKIGYTKDEGENQLRDSCYRTENPNIIHYQYYPGGTREDEAAFHKRFQDKRFKGREWFVLDKEILEFLQRNKTIKEVRYELMEFYTLEEPIIYKIHNLAVILLKFTNPEINTSDLKYPLMESTLEKELSKIYVSEGELESYLKTVYPEFNISDLNEKLRWIEENKDVEKELDTFNLIPFYHDKMRYLCLLGEQLDPVHFDLFLNSIPKEFKNYYNVLGPGGCSACSFKKSEMKKEYDKRVLNQNIDLEKEIYKEFKVGDRILKSEVKEKLGKIYNQIGYQASPKATDLEEWFELKSYKVTNKETGKRDHGFEIVSKK